VTVLSDTATGLARIVVSDESGPRGALFAAPQPVEVSRSYVVEAFATGTTAADLIAGRQRGSAPERGAIICSCNDVGANTILRAIDGGALTVDAIGAATRAGTTCGSCRSELAVFLADAMRKVAAE